MSNTRLAYSTSGEAEKPRELAKELERGTKGARIRLEKRASGRVVTVLADLPGSPADLQALAKVLKTRGGAGGSLREATLELQGDHRDAVEEVLRDRRIPHKRSGG